MNKNLDVAAMAAELSRAGNVAVFTHLRPDPDAIGSQAAAVRMLQQRGVQAVAVVLDPVPDSLKPIFQSTAVKVEEFDPEWPARRAAAFDRFLIVDTSAEQQLEPAKELFRQRSKDVLVIDHHLSGGLECSGILRDTSAAACVEIIARIAGAMGVRLDPPLAGALLAGLVGDTGWFRFDNVTAQTHRLAADLIEAGASPSRLWGDLMQKEEKAKLALQHRALGSLEWFANDRIAVMKISQADLAASGAKPWHTEQFIDIPLMVGSVIISVFLTETSEGTIRASLRSKFKVDVAAICEKFGGGGHARAAGCRLPGPLTTARDALVKAITAVLP
jgi:bifunctional oligoribonuclease and PAP phosphatase NrnA